MAKGNGVKFPLYLLASALLMTGCSSSGTVSNLEHNEASAATTPMVEAASAGELDEVRSLAEDGASLNTLTEHGTPLAAAVTGQRDDVALYLLQQGAEPDRTGPDGVTPLMQAAASGQRRMVSLLLAAGADVNARASNGASPVMMAAQQGHLSVVKMLLSAGANVNISQEGESLLMQIVERGDLLTAEVLVSAGADVDYRAEDGRTALDVARNNNNRELEMLLVQAGADI